LDFDFRAQVLPYLLRNGEENLHNLGIELPARMALNFSPSRRYGLRGAIRPIGRDGVEGVRDGKNARPQGDLIALETAGIAATIKAFLVRVNDVGRLAQEGNAALYAVTKLGMLAHDFLFFGA
jgi:hypothetical protein